jgi:hypothetical protein
MFRIDHPSGVTNLDPPTPDITGGRFFTGGDSIAGSEATIVLAEWLNTMQEEGVNLVVSAGLALDKADRTQWAQAVDAKIAAVAVNPALFVLKAGDTMTGHLQGTTIATASEINAGGAIRVSSTVAADFYLSGDPANRVLNFTTDGWRLNFAVANGTLSYSGPVPGTFTVFGTIGATGNISADNQVSAGGAVVAGTNVSAGLAVIATTSVISQGQRIISQGAGSYPCVATYDPGVGAANGIWTDSVTGNLTLGPCDGGGAPQTADPSRVYVNRPNNGLYCGGGVWPGFSYGGTGEFFCDSNAGLLRLQGLPDPVDSSQNNIYQIGVIATSANPALIFVTPAAIGGYPLGGGAWACNFQGNTSQRGDCAAASFNGVSDARLKTNMTSWTAGLAEVLQVNPISFEWNETAGMGKQGRTYYGVSAQELQTVLPEAVVSFKRYLTDESLHDDTMAEDTLTVESAVILYACVNAIKELAARLVTVEGSARA